MQPTGRVRAIDSFRGISIMLMVFFTLFGMLCREPEALTHNVPGSVHAGDFVLPMFLFASGMSLVFFGKKRARDRGYVLDVAARFVKLALVAMLLSPFSTGVLFDMDEIMLSALLFLPCALLLFLPDAAIVALMAAVAALYFALGSLSLLPDFNAAYLGGYAAAVFWLPVMLGGVLAGRRVAVGRGYAGLAAVFALMTLAFVFIFPPWKMNASPLFMALGIDMSLLAYVIIERFLERRGIRPGFVEEIGAAPMRYWILMFVFLLIPMEIYSMRIGMPLGTGWPAALTFSILSIPLLYLASRMLDALPPLPSILPDGGRQLKQGNKQGR